SRSTVETPRRRPRARLTICGCSEARARSARPASSCSPRPTPTPAARPKRRPAAHELSAIADSAKTDPLLGAARYAEGCAHVAADRFEEGREAFEDAARLLGRAGLPYETARARSALARALRGLGREDAALRELEAARAVRPTRRCGAGACGSGAAEGAS